MKTTSLSLASLTALMCLMTSNAGATVFTSTSPTTGGVLPAGVTAVGGIVFDGIGLNDARLVSQLPASSLFKGYSDDGTPSGFRGNPFTVGIQSGLTPAQVSGLGGGFKQVAIRFTLFDGDSATGNFDFNDNTLLVNGFNFGNWSSVNAEATNSSGTTGGSFSGGGFRDGVLDTGWFFSSNSTLMSNVYSTLSTGSISFQVQDSDPTDNEYDFTRGVDGSLINVGTPPVITPPAPSSNRVPDGGSTLSLLALAMVGIRFLSGRKSK